MVMCNTDFITSNQNFSKLYEYPLENTRLIDYEQRVVNFLMVNILFNSNKRNLKKNKS
jgi:hypothetical protein